VRQSNNNHTGTAVGKNKRKDPRLRYFKTKSSTLSRFYFGWAHSAGLKLLIIAKATRARKKGHPRPYLFSLSLCNCPSQFSRLNSINAKRKEYPPHASLAPPPPPSPTHMVEIEIRNTPKANVEEREKSCQTMHQVSSPWQVIIQAKLTKFEGLSLTYEASI